MQTKKKILAGALAVSLALGGFSLGRLTPMDVVQAAPETAAPRLSSNAVRITLICRPGRPCLAGCGPRARCWRKKSV